MPLAVAPPLQLSPSLGTQESIPTRRKVRTCRHWVRGICHRGAEACNFLHAFTDPTKQGLCARQLKGECNFAETCYYQHLTVPLEDYVSAARGTSSYNELMDRLALRAKGSALCQPIPSDSNKSGLKEHNRSAPPSPQPPVRHRKIKTCRAWANGTCTRSHDSCDFLHAWTNPYKAGICHRHLYGVCGYSADKCYHQHISVTLEEYVLAAQETKSFEELLSKLERNKVVNVTTGGISQRLGMGVFSSIRKETKDTPPIQQSAVPLNRSMENFAIRPLPKASASFSFYPGMDASSKSAGVEGSQKWGNAFLPFDSGKLLTSHEEDVMFRSVLQENERKSKISFDKTSQSEPVTRRTSLVENNFGETKSVDDADGDSYGGSAASADAPEFGLRKLLLEDSELFKTPTTAFNEALWETKAMEEWTSDDVFDFILSRAGKSECWEEYATKMRESQVDGKTLSVYESVNELVEDGYGLKKHHARVLLRAINDFKRQR